MLVYLRKWILLRVCLIAAKGRCNKPYTRTLTLAYPEGICLLGDCEKAMRAT